MSNQEDPNDDFAGPPAGYDRRRFSVSAESGLFPGAASLQREHKVVPKSDESREKIRTALKNSILFKHLETKELEQVVDIMFKVDLDAGKDVITQGEDGDNFYVVEKGVFDIFVSKDGNPPVKVTTVTDGGNFGELALMYNCPRAATVTATSPAVLWAMDRLSFRRILIEMQSSRRDMHEHFIDRVPLLQNLTRFERLRMADAFSPVSFSADSVIVSQGDSGDMFYVIEDGDAVVLQTPPEGGEAVEVGHLSEGDYFAEIALIKNETRKATVKALTDLRCLQLERDAFTRLLGPCEDILKRNMETYKTYADVLAEQQQ